MVAFRYNARDHRRAMTQHSELTSIEKRTGTAAAAGLRGVSVCFCLAWGSGCSDDGDDIEYDGVYINCLNENDQNSWWEIGPNGVLIMRTGTPPEFPLNACVGNANMETGGFDPVEEWDVDEYGFPAYDSKIRSICTERCEQAHDQQTNKMEVCEDANWSGHAVRAISYNPGVDGYNCVVADVHPLIQGDPYASDIDWNEGNPPVLNIPLSCSLVDDCVYEFDADIDEWAMSFAGGGAFEPIDDDSRRASYSSSTGASLELDMDFANGAGYDDEHSLTGHAEFSPSFCGGASSTCPFYLAEFEASNFADEWEIYLDLPPLVSEHKEVSGVQIEALQSTMAAWRPSTGQVAFPAGALVLQVTFELSNDTCVNNCNGYGDGGDVRQLVNPDVVFGFYDQSDNSLTLDYSFPVVGGDATLSAVLTAVDHPPEAAINLASQPRCNHADGYELSWSDSASTDPDSDLDMVVWYVDGVARANGYVMPVGAHVVGLLAVDSRGARDLATTKAVEVRSAAPCL